MYPQQSVQEFTRFAANLGVDLHISTPRVGIELMFAFYKESTPEGCEETDGDMLLFQWGTYDWGKGESFEIGITRQFMELVQEDESAISQLSLVYSFEAVHELKTLSSGHRWCDGPTEFELVREFALSSEQLASVEGRTVKSVSLAHSYV